MSKVLLIICKISMHTLGTYTENVYSSFWSIMYLFSHNLVHLQTIRFTQRAKTIGFARHNIRILVIKAYYWNQDDTGNCVFCMARYLLVNGLLENENLMSGNLTIVRSAHEPIRNRCDRLFWKFLFLKRNLKCLHSRIL